MLKEEIELRHHEAKSRPDRLALSMLSRLGSRSPLITSTRRLCAPALPKGVLTTHYKKIDRATDERWQDIDMERFADETDLLIVGGGPAGLSAAIRFKQLCNEAGLDYRVTLLEKAAGAGEHTLSGAVLEPRALEELFPDWEERGAPLKTPVTSERLGYIPPWFPSLNLPLPIMSGTPTDNHGNYIVRLGDDSAARSTSSTSSHSSCEQVRLGNFTAWLAEQAEELGVEIYTGQGGVEVLYNDADEASRVETEVAKKKLALTAARCGQVVGVATNDVGVAKDGAPKDSFERGMELRAKATLFAEGFHSKGCEETLFTPAVRRRSLRRAAAARSHRCATAGVNSVSSHPLL